MSIGTSFKTIDVSAFFTALMMRDVRRGILNMRSNDFMTWRLYFVLAVLIMVFAFAHILALQKLNAMQSERPAAVLDLHSDLNASPEARCRDRGDACRGPGSRR